MALLNQEELEIRMAEVGYAKTMASIEQAEEKGSIDSTPYAQFVYRDYVQPLAALVQQAQETRGPGRNAAHVALLGALDPWSVAYISVRVTMNAIISCPPDKTGATVRKLASSIGRAIHSELYLAQFEELKPDLYFTISEDLGRRKVQRVQNIIQAFRNSARAEGLVFQEWGPGAKDQIGCWLIEQMRKIGMIEMDTPKSFVGKRSPLSVYLAEDLADYIERAKEHFAIIRPNYGPCVEPPKPWTSWNEGGWHTKALRRMLPHPVKASSAAREQLKDHAMPVVLECLNALQSVKWQVNQRVFMAVDAVSKQRNVGELAMGEIGNKPPAPDWLDKVDPDARTPEQKEDFIAWKAAMRDWYTRNKLHRTARQRFATIMRSAREYLPYKQIYFVYFCDSRGRVYPMTQGLSPQGSDLQKGLLQFAEGKVVRKGETGGNWFLYNGANLWGFDKATPEERIRWHEDKKQLLLAIADDPIENQQWLDADSPVQFLAWCIEYRDFIRLGSVNSKLPVALDGSCSGLQHFSAMLRDEIGGSAVNLTPSETMMDIYRAVADVAHEEMKKADPDEDGLRAVWLSHGINRKVTKRSVMTTSYGVTKRSAIRYVMDDYLSVVDIGLPYRYHYKAASYLMQFVWPAISAVVVKGKEAMAWLEKAGKDIVKAGNADDGVIYWTTPSGFLASQTYYEFEERYVATKLYGHARVKVLEEGTTTSASRHSQGLSPNFIHSMDASHLHLTTARMARKIPGVSLSMIHDSFGTHAADTETLYRVLREEFVRMYEEHDPINEFAQKYGIPKPPKKGNLDLSLVLQSRYVFS